MDDIDVYSNVASDIDSDNGENEDVDAFIQVQDTIYAVSSRMLLEESPGFCQIYKLPRTEYEHATQDIILLPREIKCEQFVALLKVLRSDPCIFGNPGLTKKEWVSVLKLSTIWHFIDARNFAIIKLRPLLNSVDRVVLGREFYVSSWVNIGLRRLAARSRTIEDDEAEKLTFYTAIQLLRIRERRRSKPEIFDLVTEVFKDELAFIRSQEEIFVFAKDPTYYPKLESPTQREEGS